MVRIWMLVAGLAAVMFTGLSAQAADQHARWAGGDVQILGFDTTAFFVKRQPVEGASRNVAQWNGGTWHFKTTREASLFRANPTAYAPQFGAYCTGGLSQKHVVNGNPANWRIHNGKLYLFYAATGARRFDKDPDGVIQAARAYAKTVGIQEN